MALASLKDVKKIGDFDVVVMDKLREEFPEKFNESGAMDYKWFEKDVRPYNFVYIRHDVNSISFTLQNGPIKVKGVNGCQIETIIEAAALILKGLAKDFPSREKAFAIASLYEALYWLVVEKRDSGRPGVEGFNENRSREIL
jgi:hypothetical protein